MIVSFPSMDDEPPSTPPPQTPASPFSISICALPRRQPSPHLMVIMMVPEEPIKRRSPDNNVAKSSIKWTSGSPLLQLLVLMAADRIIIIYQMVLLCIIPAPERNPLHSIVSTNGGRLLPRSSFLYFYSHPIQFRSFTCDRPTAP